MCRGVGVDEPVLLEQGDLIIITHGAEHVLSDPHKVNALTVDQVIEQSGFTGKGALAAMLVGFAGVPLFKFAAPLLPEVGPFFAALGELPPAFMLSALVGVMVSRLDAAGPPAHAVGDLDDALR